MIACTFFFARPVAAATTTVCAASCSETTLLGALTAATDPGDVVAVGATYDPAGDTGTFPITTLSSGVTINCEDSGAVISQTDSDGDNLIYMPEASTIRNCGLGNISLRSSDSGSNNIKILNNDFSAFVTSTIHFQQGIVNDFLIEGNSYINAFSILPTATSSGGIIRDNTFYFRDLADHSRPFDAKSPYTDDLQILSNTFESYLTEDASSELIYIEGSGLVFATNTVLFLTSPSTTMNTSVSIGGVGNNSISGNIIMAPPKEGSCSGLSLTLNGDEYVGWNVYRNTIHIHRDCQEAAGLVFSDNNRGVGGIVQGEVYYNLLYREGDGHEDDQGIRLEKASADTAFSMNNDYNAISDFSNTLFDKFSNTGVALGAQTFLTAPALRTGNASATDDYELAPFSRYLDINGTIDIGAISGSRSSTIHVAAGEDINYSSVDATTTVDIGASIRSGDTISIANGTYAPFSVSSALVTTTITVIGTGDSVFIDGNLSSQDDGILFENVTSSAITNLTVRNASSTAAPLYAVDLVNGIYNGVTYDEASADAGSPASSSVILYGDGGRILSYTANATDVGAVMDVGFADWHLVMANISGDHASILIPGFVANSAAELAGMFVVDAFATSTFVYNASDQTFTFNQAALDAANITLASWVPLSPELSKTPGRRLSGIRLNNSNGVTLTSVTSTANGNGVSFGTGSRGNTVAESYFSGSTHYDLNHESDLRNTIDNTSFNQSSTTFTGLGDLLVKFKARIQALRIGSEAVIVNADVTSTNAAGSSRSLGQTDSLGYTSFMTFPSYTMSATTTALTHGGYNPHVFQVATSTFATTSTSQTVSTRNVTYTVGLLSLSGPSAPSGVGAAHVSTSTATFGWIDNADDEESFTIELRNISEEESYPGTSYSVVGENNRDMTGLTPGHQYEFRVAAVNTAATSTYATSSVFTMSAVAPLTPTLTSLSRTSFSLGLNTNGNATSVQYAIYSSTLGGYFDASAAVTATPTWQTSSTWATLTISGLTCNTAYSAEVVARNIAESLTATSSVAIVTTEACETSSSGSSGGGGGSGNSQVVPIGVIAPPTVSPPVVSPAPAPVPVPSPIENTPSVSEVFLLEDIEVLLNGMNTPRDLVAESRIKKLAQADLGSFKVTASAEQMARLTNFIVYGNSAATKRLGEGERRAVIRDALETMKTASISADDLDRMTRGLKANYRNITVERAQLPIVRATFRTLYGRDPNFKNPEEDLAWNTMMYRIRFPRDLPAEKEGIVEFRETFQKSPQTPFQWAVVRVLGYVR